MSLYAELKRRNVFRVAAAYLVLGWLFLQIASVVLSFVGAPDWVGKAIIALLVIGFVPALAVAWVFEVGPEGIQRDDGKTLETNGRHARRLDILTLIGVVVVVLMVFAEQVRVPEKEEKQKPESDSDPLFAGPEKGANAASVAVAVQAVPRKSIAVLPFADLSPKHDQEYFSDGIAEELLNALAKVKDLKVAGRTSSFSFKGKNQDLRSIGRTLAVANVLEGSVRKQGEKVRITAQLIQVEDGYHLWSESYDGDLSDVFQLQERIARAITQELQVVLQGEQQARLVPEATTSTQAYSNYLRATVVFNRRDGARFPEAMDALREAIRLDPKFARAHSRLAALHVLAVNYTGMEFAQTLAAGEREARIAIALDPALGEPHAVLGLMHGFQREFLRAHEELERALALDSQDVSANFWMGTGLVTWGYVAKGLASFDRALAIDPLLPNALAWRGTHYLAAGDRDNAQRMLQASVGQGLAFGEQSLAMLAHADGNDEDAIAMFSRGARVFLIGFSEDASERLARGFFGDAAARKDAIGMIDAYLATHPRVVSGAAPWALMMLGEPLRALLLAQDAATTNDSLFFNYLWMHWGKPVRTLPQFPAFVRKTGLAALWDRHGEPDLCRKGADGEYACE